MKKCYIDINRVIQSGGSLDSISSRYTLVPTEKDYQVQTSDGVLTLRVEKDNKLVLLQTASIKHGDKDLGTVRFPASF